MIKLTFFLFAILLVAISLQPTLCEEHEDGDHDHDHDHAEEAEGAVGTEAAMDDHDDHDHDDHDDHDHDDHSDEASLTCACAAVSAGFTINCDDMGPMLTAWEALEANSCNTSCSSDVCRDNFYNIQAHHDHCLDGQVPGVIEKGIHDFEDVCKECSIPARSNPAFSPCPTVSCEPAELGRGDEAFQALVAGGCMNGCNPATCAEHYQVLVGVHDNCDHDALSEEAEKGLHDFEGVCEPVAGCNAPGAIGPDETLVCEDVTASGAAVPVLLPAFAVIAAALIAAM